MKGDVEKCATKYILEGGAGPIQSKGPLTLTTYRTMVEHEESEINLETFSIFSQFCVVRHSLHFHSIYVIGLHVGDKKGCHKVMKCYYRVPATYRWHSTYCSFTNPPHSNLKSITHTGFREFCVYSIPFSYPLLLY